MKKKYWLAACLSLGLMTACDEDNKKEVANNEKYAVEVPKETEPVADLEQVSKMSVRLGGYDFEVGIRRYPDRSLPLVVDELEQKFYDNSVEVTILRDGEVFMTKTVTKKDFEKYLTENFAKSSLLLGMNCDTARCNQNTLCLTAQVGQAGEGPAFLVLIPVRGGNVSVLRDESQDDISYKDVEQ